MTYFSDLDLLYCQLSEIQSSPHPQGLFYLLIHNKMWWLSFLKAALAGNVFFAVVVVGVRYSTCRLKTYKQKDDYFPISVQYIS